MNPANVSCFPRRFEDASAQQFFIFKDVFKTCLQDAFQRRLQDVFTRRLQDLFQDVFQDYLLVLQTRLEDVLEDKKMLHGRRFKTSSRRLHQDECLPGSVLLLKFSHEAF